MGWDTPSGERTTASQLWPKNGVGHLAFTGCSLWIAPDEKVVVAFCSNFVHPKVEGGAIPSLKPIPTRQQLSQLRREIHVSLDWYLGDEVVGFFFFLGTLVPHQKYFLLHENFTSRKSRTNAQSNSPAVDLPLDVVSKSQEIRLQKKTGPNTCTRRTQTKFKRGTQKEN